MPSKKDGASLDVDVLELLEVEHAAQSGMSTRYLHNPKALRKAIKNVQMQRNGTSKCDGFVPGNTAARVVSLCRVRGTSRPVSTEIYSALRLSQANS